MTQFLSQSNRGWSTFKLKYVVSDIYVTGANVHQLYYTVLGQDDWQDRDGWTDRKSGRELNSVQEQSRSTKVKTGAMQKQRK